MHNNHAKALISEWNDIFVDELEILGIKNDMPANSFNNVLDDTFLKLASWNYGDEVSYMDTMSAGIHRLQFIRQCKAIMLSLAHTSGETRTCQSDLFDVLDARPTPACEIRRAINKWANLPTKSGTRNNLSQEIYKNKMYMSYLHGIDLVIEKKPKAMRYFWAINNNNPSSSHVLFARNPYITGNWSDDKLEKAIAVYLDCIRYQHVDETINKMINALAEEFGYANAHTIGYLFKNISHVLHKLNSRFLAQFEPAPLCNDMSEKIACLIEHNRGYKPYNDDSADTYANRHHENTDGHSYVNTNNYPDEITGREYHEGAAKRVPVNRYERDTKARDACINKYGWKCQICGLDFEEMYGEIGHNFIHVHHKIPLNSIGMEYIVDPANDLIPLCPNCHAMIHKLEGEITGDAAVEQLKDIISKHKNS